MKHTAFILLLLFIGATTKAQSIDILTLDYENGPGANETFSNSQMNYSRFGVDLLLPLARKNGDYWLTGFIFNSVNLDFKSDSLSSINAMPTTLKIGYLRNVNEKLKINFFVLPKQSSNWTGDLTKGMQIGALSYAEYKASEKFIWKFGVYGNTEFCGPLLVPIISLDYLPNPKWSLKGLFPISYGITRHISPKTNLGIYYRGIVETYYTRIGNQDYYTEFAPQNGYLFYEHKAGSNLWIRLRAGASVFRSITLYDYGNQMDLRLSAFQFGNNRGNAYRKVGDSALFMLSFVYRYEKS